MTSKIEHLNGSPSRWARLSDWLGTLDSSLDIDPVQNSLNEAMRKVEQLEARISKLEVDASRKED